MVGGGFKAATKDRGQITEWWLKCPQANIGMPTGGESFYVLDVDMHNEVDGIATLEAWEDQHGNLPATVEQQTGGGGYQIFFQYSDGELKNKTDMLPGLDFRGDGGYIIVPPSLHKSGKNYGWVKDRRLGEIGLAMMPDALISLVTETRNISRAQRDSPEGMPFKEGRRNSDFAGLAGYCLRKGFPQEQALNLALAQNSTLPQPLDYLEVTTIVEGFYKRYEHPEPLITPRHTDDGNAMRLAAFANDRLLYVYLWKQWLSWDGTRWKVAECGEQVTIAKEMIRTLLLLAIQIDDEDKRKAFLGNALSLESVARKESMFKSTQEVLGITPAVLDLHPMFFNVERETIDLKTGKVGKPDPSHLMTQLAPIQYDPKAQCPVFLDFLDRIFDGNRALIDFIQRAVGYSLTGSTVEQVFFLCWGRGANGKSTFLETIAAMLGDYAKTAEFKSFLSKKTDAVRNDLARLFGSRFVKAVEPEAGATFSEPVIKEVTGGDTISARFLYKEFFEFKPAFKIWLATNHKPAIKGTDEGIWRRILLIPFEVTIPKNEQDKKLSQRLKTELPGILIWALQGVLEWQEQGLNPPDEVLAATKEYRDDEDVFGSFISDTCNVHDSLRVRNKDIWDEYIRWCDRQDENPIGAKEFKSKIEQRGFRQVKVNGNRIWKGVNVDYGWRNEPDG